MAFSKVFFVLVVALLVASVTCVESAAAIQAVEGAASPSIGSGFRFSRTMLSGGDTGTAKKKRRRRKSSKKVVKKKKVKKNKAKSTAFNQNDEGVLINQQTTANIKGDGNLVAGGVTGPVRYKMKKLPCFFAALLLSQAKLTSCEDDVITELFKGYDKAIRPNHGTGKPVTIRSSIYVESFGNIEEANMEFKAYIYFRQLWKDLRLTGRVNDTFTIRGGEVDNIWTPDPYCYNARESNMMTPNEEVNVNVQISPNGNITSSRGVTLLASCVMNLRTFPRDSQQCHLKFGSYSYTSSDIVYEWIPGEVQFGNKELSQFQLKGSELTSKIEVFSVGNYSTMTVTFSFERRIGYFLIQVYFPDIFVVMLSWIVFWMEKDDIGNRMALGITTILTIMFLLGSLNGNLPKVSYPKALDWYLLVSFSFVFLSLIECMIVYLFVAEAKQDKQKPIKVMENGVPLSEKVFSSLTSLVSFRGKKSGNEGMNKEPGNELEMVNGASKADNAVVEDGYQDDTSTFHKMEKIANAIDKASRFLFPFFFICFNIFYWTYY